MHAEILAIGDEITSGQTLDTNSQWLSQRLEELGVRTLYHSTVGDELAPSADVFRQAIDRADVVVATGGLGPTADDLARAALALATGRPLQLDTDALQHIRRMFADRRRPMPPQNDCQAMFPAGSQVICNPHGTAPGIDLEVPRSQRPSCRVFCLPGVPAEMVEMWHASVAPAINALLGEDRTMIRRWRIHCFGAGESQIESMLPDLIRRGRQPTVGITASKATISLRIAAEGRTEAECSAAIDATAMVIRQSLGKLVFGEEDDDLQHVVVRLLGQQGKTLATAECGTAGLVAEWLGGIDGSAGAYRGGVVLMEAATPVDAMAVRCRQQFNADYGLAVGPFPQDLHSPIGRGAEVEDSQPRQVSISLASPDGVQSRTIPFAIHPALRRIYFAKHALNFLRLALLP